MDTPDYGAAEQQKLHILVGGIAGIQQVALG